MSRMDVLDNWRYVIVGDNLIRFGCSPGKDLAISRYLQLATQNQDLKAQSFREMCSFMGLDAGELEGRHVQE